MASFRVDTGSLGKAEPTPSGGLKIPAFPTRVGVFLYRMKDGTTRRELRRPEEVFHPDSLASLRGAPVTDLHPQQDGQPVQVTAVNWKALAVGHAGEDVRPDGDFVSASLLVQDQGMLDKIAREERRECSCGYTCDYKPGPGIWEPTGEPYDGEQTRIKYNHIALGPNDWGRAGPEARLRLDAGDGIQVPREGTQVEYETIDGVQYKVGTPEHVAALRKSRDTHQGRADAAEKAAKTATEKAAKDKEEADKAAKTKTDAGEIRKVAKHRAKLLSWADQIATSQGLKFDADDPAVEAASEPELVVRLILQLDPTFKPDGKSPDYLAGVLETMMKNIAKAAPAAASTDPAAAGAAQGEAAKTDSKDLGGIFKAREGQVSAPRTDATDKETRIDADESRKAMLKVQREAGTGKLAITRT